MKRIYEFPWPDLRVVQIRHCCLPARSISGRFLTFFIFAATFFDALLINGQDRRVTGKITSISDQQPLPGVNVIVKGTNLGTATDANGLYNVIMPSHVKELVFSFMGFKTQTVEVGERTIVDISMETDVMQLAEVVVTGTGLPVEKRKLGVSVETLKSDQFPLVPTASIDQTLVGRIPGAQISSIQGTPGSEMSILLRGINSINKSTMPMIMMDGVQMAATNLSSIDATTIDRVEVVQGAAAASVYGAQGANGVIQLFTKKGKIGATKIDFSMGWTTTEFLNVGNVRKAKLHGFKTNAANEVIDVDDNPISQDPDNLMYSGDVVIDAFDPASVFDKEYGQNLKYIDQFKVFLRPASIFNARVGVSGAGEKSDYNIMLSKNRHESNFATQGYNDRTNLMLNYGIEVMKNLRFRSITQLIYNYNTIDIHEKQDFGYNTSTFQFLNSQSFVDYQIKDTEENYGWFYGQTGGVNYRNPFYRQQYSTSTDKKIDIMQNASVNYVLNRNFNLELLYGINHQTREVRYLALNQSLNANSNANSNIGNRNKFFVNNWQDNTGEITLYDLNRTFQNFKATANIQLDSKRDLDWNFPLISSTQLSFDYRDDDEKRRESYALGMPLDPPIIASLGKTFNIPSDWGQRFVTYGYVFSQRFEVEDIAGLSVGFRSDYSSAFGRGSKPFTFPRADVYFRVSALKFWNSTGLTNTILDWKLRAAYGEAGIQPKPFDRYVTLSTRTLGTDNAYFINAYQSNPDLSVEVSKEFEIGTDLVLDGMKGNWLNNFQVALTFWQRSTENGIVRTDMAPSSGTGKGLNNALFLESSGIQASLLATVNRSAKFNWDMTVNFSTQESLISDVEGGPVDVGGRLLKAGDDVGQFNTNMFLTDVNQLKPDGQPFIPADEQSNYSVASNGWVVNNSTKRPFISADQYGVGSPNPDFIISAINDFNFGQYVSFSFQVDWVAGADLYNQAREWMYRDMVHPDYEIPIEINGETGAWSAFYQGAYDFSSGWQKNYFVEDASFVRLRNVTIGFNINRIFHMNKFTQLNLQLSGRNLWTKTKYSGMDPEISSWDNESIWYGPSTPLYRGVDDSTQPNFRSYQITLNISI